MIRLPNNLQKRYRLRPKNDRLRHAYRNIKENIYTTKYRCFFISFLGCDEKMLSYISEQISTNWSKQGIIDTESKDVYRYGIEIILSSLIGIVSVITIGIMLSAVLEAFVFLAIFIPLRMYTGGFHAKTYVRCNLTTVALFAIQVSITSLFILNGPIYIIGIVIGLIIILALAPIKNVNKIIEAENRKKYKRLALLIYAGYILCFILCYNFSYNRQVYDSIYIALMEVITLMLVGFLKGGIRDDESEQVI